MTQLVGTVKNKTYLLAMDCAARPAIAAVESNFEIRIDSRTAQKVSFAAIGTNK